MTLFQRKIWICFMGFSVLTLFNVNHPAFADEKSDTTVKEKVEETGKDIKRGTKKGVRKVKDKTCEMVNGKLECAAKKVKHSVENGVDKVKDTTDKK